MFKIFFSGIKVSPSNTIILVLTLSTVASYLLQIGSGIEETGYTNNTKPSF